MRRFIIGILIGGCIGTTGAIAGGIDTRATVPAGYGSRAVVHGCAAEDDCKANYHGNGTWTIRRDKH